MTFASFNSSDMECTTGATFKTWRIMKDARTVYNTSLLFAILLG
jgi:hypothetical protein